MNPPLSRFSRAAGIRRLQASESWDCLVIGGGATGLGVAVDAATRGYRTLLVEQSDFARGTSSRSTKLVHGGVRYLAQGNIRLVYEALHERGLLERNAPHLVRRQSFVIPLFRQQEWLRYWPGLKFYDWLSGTLSFGSSQALTVTGVRHRLPMLTDRELKGGIEYFDGQFDDARLAVNLAQTASDHGATVLNYVRLTGFVKNDRGKIIGARLQDMETGDGYEVKARVVINATGVEVDDILAMDDPEARTMVRVSQGVHLVVPAEWYGSGYALLIPKTSDGRVLFAVPWHGKVLLGTTDTPLRERLRDPMALPEEISFILQTINQYGRQPLQPENVLSVFAGLRPLAATSNEKRTKELSRSHKLLHAPSGLVTITGGKWTTYRKMAEDTVSLAARLSGLPPVPCRTAGLPLHGSTTAPASDHLAPYGSDAAGIQNLMRAAPALAHPLHPGLPYTAAEVVWAVREEMARRVEDVLARRLRILFLDAGAAQAAAPRVAELMREELGKSEDWKAAELSAFRKLALSYTLSGHFP